MNDLQALTSNDNYFDDFPVGRRIRHARGATVDEVENNLLSKLVMNTAQGHWNDDVMKGHPLGEGRVVFGLITASIVFGLAGQDTGENAIRELGCSALRFKAPVHHGDTVYAYTEVIAATPSEDMTTGLLTFHHWGVNQDGVVVFEGEREVLMKRKHATT